MIGTVADFSVSLREPRKMVVPQPLTTEGAPGFQSARSSGPASLMVGWAEGAESAIQAKSKSSVEGL